MVQPCDKTQERSDSDFGVKRATIQVYGNGHNSQSDRWIGLIFMSTLQTCFPTLG